MTTVVGINWPSFHDNAAAAIIDGRLVFASEEERYSRHKHSHGELAQSSLLALFKHIKKLGVNPNDIDAFAINFDPNLYLSNDRRECYNDRLSIDAARIGLFYSLDFGAEFKKLCSSSKADRSPISVLKIFIRHIYKKAGEEAPLDLKIFAVPHHLAHAASSYYFSGFDSCAAIAMDGAGETEATSIWKVKNGNFERICSADISDSIGYLYENIGTRLGFNGHEAPGKVMGLAPYGKINKVLSKKFGSLISLKGDAVFPPYLFDPSRKLRKSEKMDLNYVRDFWDGFVTAAVGSLDLAWDTRGEIKGICSDVAWCLQNITEKLIENVCRYAKEQSGSKLLALSGGVALNAKANMELHYSHMFNDIYIFPAANDSGTTAGAAAYVYENILGNKMQRKRLRSACLGPEYSEDSVREIIKKSKWKAEFLGDDVCDVSKLVSKGKVVAWYQGRAEFGPRALGNRSIIADPRNKKMWHKLNEIKGREWWRPLAPSLLEEEMHTYFVDPAPHEFMVMMYKLKDDAKNRVPAIYHVDGTARVQTVRRNENKNWYEMIDGFQEITNEGLVINTSFNLAGEPLVETPTEALRSFAVGGFDAIYLQGWLIKKY